MAEQQNVIFKLDDVEYGIDIMQVNEIVKLQPITKMPNTQDFVDGVINLRGRVIPVVDLKVKFNLGRKERNENNRIIVINVNNKTLGMVVDEVAEVIRINEEQIDDAEAISVDINEDYIRGVAKIESRLVILLNLENIF
ncbi:MAG: purine-binding chemotaxis protein CheW [Clostridia bacterium]|nr:purine-binding chemotaxis protein CheW [Clostridia bacterium]MDN5323208.1 purine-binding chemotaxis protein CheW [Clostridia bacterium]